MGIEKSRAVVIGYGRFGRLLADSLSESFDFSVIEKNSDVAAEAAQRYPVIDIEQAGEYEFIFLAVPISEFEETVEWLAPITDDLNVVVDLCSVKVFPARVMQKLLSEAQLIATHPLFGPDSAKSGFDGLKTAIAPVRAQESSVQKVADAWQKTGVEVIMTTPEEHDKDTAYSQAFTYSVARLINNMRIDPITFDTRSYKAITKVAELSANDTEQLFHDMMHYNPYFPAMFAQLRASWQETEATLADIAAEESPIVFDD